MSIALFGELAKDLLCLLVVVMPQGIDPIVDGRHCLEREAHGNA
ncbi:hypothetical protein [Celerinatantimonas diazotrophica]|nr:hypothetical protein [Celerinatantimonas diazotrophica]